MKLYKYSWGTWSKQYQLKRKPLKGRICRIIHCGRMNSCLVEFVDTKQKECVDRRSLRKYDIKTKEMRV